MALDPTRNELLTDVLIELLIQGALLAKASDAHITTADVDEN